MSSHPAQIRQRGDLGPRLEDNEVVGKSSHGSTGRYECGGVRYRPLGDLRSVINSHCDRCHRTTGHFMAASGCAAGDVEIESDSTLRWYEPAPGVFYGFYGTRGSTLFWRADGVSAWVSIAAGTLERPTESACPTGVSEADRQSGCRQAMRSNVQRGPLAPASLASQVTRGASRRSARVTYAASYAVTLSRSSHMR